MKKKLNGFYWFHFLLFGFAAMVGLNAIGKEIDMFAHLDGLLARGNREYQACRDFKIEWQELEKGLEKIQLENPKHRTKEESLRVLAALERRPGVAPSYAEAKHFLAANFESLAKHPEQAEILIRWGKIEPECELLSMMRGVTRLYGDVKAYSFSESEAGRVRNLTRQVLFDIAPDYALLTSAVRNSVLGQYLEHLYQGTNKEELLKKQKHFAKTFEEKRTAVSERSKTHSYTKPKLDEYALEFQFTQELGKEYANIVKEVIDW